MPEFELGRGVGVGVVVVELSHTKLSNLLGVSLFTLLIKLVDVETSVTSRANVLNIASVASWRRARIVFNNKPWKEFLKRVSATDEELINRELGEPEHEAAGLSVENLLACAYER